MLGVVPVGNRDPLWFAVDLDVSYTKGSLSLMVHFSVSDTVLASRQLVSGGWSFASSQQSSIEATCLAAFALADEMPANAGASTQFLLKSQFADGCWPAFEGDSEGSWTTALSLCYLNGMTDFASAREKASHWLVEERGREAHWFWRWKFKTADRNVSFDPDKYGWPWISCSASWVIPTAFSVIALKQFTVCNRSELSEKRIRLGLDMLLDRACAGGGWNSGNSIVYGVPLPAHVEATAIALLALQDEERTPVIRASLAWLKQRSAQHRSGGKPRLVHPLPVRVSRTGRPSQGQTGDAHRRWPRNS